MVVRHVHRNAHRRPLDSTGLVQQSRRDVPCTAGAHSVLGDGRGEARAVVGVAVAAHSVMW